MPDEDEAEGHHQVGNPCRGLARWASLLPRRRPWHRAEERRGQQQEQARKQHREHCRSAQVAEHGDQTIDQDPDRGEEQSPRHLPKLPPLAEKHADQGETTRERVDPPDADPATRPVSHRRPKSMEKYLIFALASVMRLTTMVAFKT